MYITGRGGVGGVGVAIQSANCFLIDFSSGELHQKATTVIAAGCR